MTRQKVDRSTTDGVLLAGKARSAQGRSLTAAGSRNLPTSVAMQVNRQPLPDKLLGLAVGADLAVMVSGAGAGCRAVTPKSLSRKADAIPANCANRVTGACMAHP